MGRRAANEQRMRWLGQLLWHPRVTCEIIVLLPLGPARMLIAKVLRARPPLQMYSTPLSSSQTSLLVISCTAEVGIIYYPVSLTQYFSLPVIALQYLCYRHCIEQLLLDSAFRHENHSSSLLNEKGKLVSPVSSCCHSLREQNFKLEQWN